MLLAFGVFTTTRFVDTGNKQGILMDKQTATTFGTDKSYTDEELGTTLPVEPEPDPTPELPEEEPTIISEFVVRYNAMGGSYVPNRAPGLYTMESTTLLYSWDELINDGLVVVEDGTITYVDKKLRGDLVIAEGVTTIIRDIGLDTGGMKLYNVFIPKTVVNIDVVGLNNSNLRNIYVDEENPNFQSINGTLFSKDGKRLLRFPKGRGVKYVVIPEGVETIDYDSVSYTKILYVIIPTSVKSIGRYAFNGNPTIEKVYYTGSESQWSNINIVATYNFYMTDAARYYNYHVAEEDGLYNVNEVNYKGIEITSGTYKEPIMTGKTFAGWYTDPSCKAGTEFNIAKATQDIIVYAKWN